MYYDILAERVRYFKETEEGQEEMCEMMEEMQRKAEKRGERRGEKRGRKAELERINTLNRRLQEDGRMDDLIKSITDGTFQRKLLSEYSL